MWTAAVTSCKLHVYTGCSVVNVELCFSCYLSVAPMSDMYTWTVRKNVNKTRNTGHVYWAIKTMYLTVLGYAFCRDNRVLVLLSWNGVITSTCCTKTLSNAIVLTQCHIVSVNIEIIWPKFLLHQQSYYFAMVIGQISPPPPLVIRSFKLNTLSRFKT